MTRSVQPLHTCLITSCMTLVFTASLCRMKHVFLIFSPLLSSSYRPCHPFPSPYLDLKQSHPFFTPSCVARSPSSLQKKLIRLIRQHSLPMNCSDDFTSHRPHPADSPRSRWGDGRSRTLPQERLSQHAPPMLHSGKLSSSQNISIRMCLCASELRKRKRRV